MRQGWSTYSQQLITILKSNARESLTVDGAGQTLSMNGYWVMCPLPSPPPPNTEVSWLFHGAQAVKDTELGL